MVIMKNEYIPTSGMNING